MDQVVIKNFKHFYRSTVVQKILREEYIDANGTIKINILQATWMCYSAWDQVKPATIANCFWKAGFVHKGEVIAEGTEEIVINGIALEELVEQIKFEQLWRIYKHRWRCSNVETFRRKLWTNMCLQKRKSKKNKNL